MKICLDCGTTEDKSPFIKNKNKCKVCANKYHYSKIRKRRKMVNELKRNKPCLDCGKNYHPIAMDFDHIGSDKEDDITSLIERCVSQERIISEIAKCELVCANCHRIRTFIRLHGLEEYELTK